jgi:elongation factor Ts
MSQSKHIESYVHDGRIGVLVEFKFEDSSHDLAMHIAATNPKSLEDLLQQCFVKDPDISVEKVIQQHIMKFGENIEVSRFTRWDTEPTSPNDGGGPPKDPALALRVVK